MYVYKPERCLVPIKVWAEKGAIEQGALTQIENTASWATECLSAVLLL